MQNNVDVQPPASPAPSATPATPAPMVVTTRMVNPAPITSADVEALLARKEVLSNQLNSAVGRRRDLARQLRGATGMDKTGLEQRLAVLQAPVSR